MSFIARQCLPEGHGVVLVFDVTARRTLQRCDQWVRELCKKGEPERAVVAVGNKIDLADRREVSTEEARAHFESMTPNIPYFEASALTGEGVNDVFQAVVRMVRDENWTVHPSQNDN